VRTPITLTVKLSDILINAMIRVEFMSVGGSLPCFDALGISMVRNPRIDFSLDALGGDLTCLPGLEGMINSTIKSILAEMLVWPHRMVFPTKAGVDVKSLAQSGGKQGVDAVCILRCTVIEASSLETFGNEDFLEKIAFQKSIPDPYVVFERGVRARSARISIFSHFRVSIASLKLEEYHSHLPLMSQEKSKRLDFKLEYYENLTRASHSNPGTPFSKCVTKSTRLAF
jgi:Ca2+-dependent lipid-binding protein